MIRFLVALIVFLAGIVFTILTSGSRILTFVDVPSLLISGIFPFLFASIVFGFGEMSLAFSSAFKRDADFDTLKKALLFFDFYGKVTLIAGAIGSLIGVISMLANLEDKAAIGPNLAVALITLYYSGIIYALIILPFTVFIKKKLNE